MGLRHLMTLGPFSREYGHSLLFHRSPLNGGLFLVFWLSHEMSLTLIDGHPSLSSSFWIKVIRLCYSGNRYLGFLSCSSQVGLSQVLILEPRFRYLCLFSLLCLGLCCVFLKGGRGL